MTLECTSWPACRKPIPTRRLTVADGCSGSISPLTSIWVSWLCQGWDEWKRTLSPIESLWLWFIGSALTSLACPFRQTIWCHWGKSLPLGSCSFHKMNCMPDRKLLHCPPHIHSWYIFICGVKRKVIQVGSLPHWLLWYLIRVEGGATLLYISASS